MKKPKLLVMDLNGTLVDRQRFGKNSYILFQRPELKEFLKCLDKSNITLAVWSSCKMRNVQSMVNVLFKSYPKNLEFVWDRTYTDPNPDMPEKDWATVKDLSKIWNDSSFNGKWTQQNTVLLEDDSTKIVQKDNSFVLHTYKYQCEHKKNPLLQYVEDIVKKFKALDGDPLGMNVTFQSDPKIASLIAMAPSNPPSIATTPCGRFSRSPAFTRAFIRRKSGVKDERVSVSRKYRCDY